MIEFKICFIAKKNEGCSVSVQAVQDISESDRRLKEFNDFERILEDTKFSDMKILVDGKQFHAHRIILASRSSVFAAMFEHNMKERNIDREIMIDDISHDVMKEVLRFIYAGKVNNVENLACDLFVAADKYNLEGLKDICEEVLINRICLDNICEILAVVGHCKTNRLHSAAIKFVHMNAALLVTRKEFNSTMILLSKKMGETLDLLA